MTVPQIKAETPGVKPTVRVRLCPDPLSPPIRGQKQDLTLQYNVIKKGAWLLLITMSFEPAPLFRI